MQSKEWGSCQKAVVRTANENDAPTSVGTSLNFICTS